MIITFNYLISLFSYFAWYGLSKRGTIYNNAAKFMLYFGSAALLGGLTHSMETYSTIVSQAIDSFNLNYSHLPALSEKSINIRLWYSAVVSIGFAEYFFMFLFIEPIIHENQNYIKIWLKIALLLYCVVALLSSAYFYVVIFHVITHTVIIAFSLITYWFKKIKALLLLAILALYNLTLGIIQQLMAHQIIPTGPLHYNDWYHIGVSLFVIAMYLLFTKGKLIESLQEINPYPATSAEGSTQNLV